MSSKHYITNIHLDEKSVVRRAAHVEHERKVAVYDLLDENYFKPVGGAKGPFDLHLSIEENRLVFDILLENGDPVDCFTLPLNTFRHERRASGPELPRLFGRTAKELATH